MGSKPPVEYDPATFPQRAAEKMAAGYTRKMLAAYFGVSTKTIYEWAKTHCEFGNAIKRGADFVDQLVENALLKRALGYEYDESEQILDIRTRQVVRAKKVRKLLAPDVTAQIFWLKNRKPDEWRDRHSTELTGKDGNPIQVEAVNADGIISKLLPELAAGGTEEASREPDTE